MQLRVERTVPFSRDAVFAWWTDYEEGDHHGHGRKPKVVREILRREEREVWLRDRRRGLLPVAVDSHVTLDPPGAITVEGRYPAADARYEYRFNPVPEGTRMSLHAEVQPRGIGRILLPLLGRRVPRYVERDTAYHLREMAQDLGGATAKS